MAQFPPPLSFCLSVFSHPLCDHLRLCLLSSLLGAVCHDWTGDAPILLCFIFFAPVSPLLQLGLWPLETVTELPVSDNPRGMNFLAASPSAALPTPACSAGPHRSLDESGILLLLWLWGPILLQAVVLPLAECPRANAGCPGRGNQSSPGRAPWCTPPPIPQAGESTGAAGGAADAGEAREGARRGR